MKNVYVCKRMRLLTHLKKAGFYPFKVIPDVNNPKFNVWLFERSEKLDKELKNYFSKFPAPKMG